MTPAEAKAQVFYTAFITLPKIEKDLFFSKVVKNNETREDLLDIAVAESKKHEKSTSFKRAIKEIRTKRKHAR